MYILCTTTSLAKFLRLPVLPNIFDARPSTRLPGQMQIDFGKVWPTAALAIDGSGVLDGLQSWWSLFWSCRLAATFNQSSKTWLCRCFMSRMIGKKIRTMGGFIGFTASHIPMYEWSQNMGVPSTTELSYYALAMPPRKRPSAAAEPKARGWSVLAGLSQPW